MDDLSYRDNNLITDAQGVWTFTPGMMARDWVMVRMALSIGEIAKDMGMGGCDHKLTLTYLNVEPEDVEATFEALQLLWSPLSGSPQSGTLVVPDYGSYKHCIVTACEPGEMRAVTKGISPADPIGTRCYDLDFDITFRQLRR